MGDRNDNIIDDERADAVLRRTLARDGMDVPAPPHLVARALERLPPVPPAEAARRVSVRRRNRVVAISSVLVPLALLALLNVWSVAARGPQMAFMFGDGRSGVSSALLGLHLTAKPLWNTLRSVEPIFLLSGFVGIAACVFALRRLVRHFQNQYEAEEL